MANTPSVAEAPELQPTPSFHRLALHGYLMSVGSYVTGVSVLLPSGNLALLHLASGPRSDDMAASEVPLCRGLACVAFP